MKLAQVLSIIASEIIPSDMAVAKDILKWYIDRTREHVASVQEFAARACAVFRDEPWCCLLKAQAVRHDFDKLHDDLFIAHYAPYIVKRYCNDGLQDRFELKDDYKKKWDEEYVVQHCMNNGHHPEYWDVTYSYGENHPPYDATGMPVEYLAEMVCDWCAVGREQGNSAAEWFAKVDGTRFLFSEFQRQFISRMIEAIE